MGTSLAPDSRLLDKQEDERLRQRNEGVLGVYKDLTAGWRSLAREQNDEIAMLKEWRVRACEEVEVTNALRQEMKRIEALITDSFMCHGSEFAGDLGKMVEYLIERARRPYPRRILEAEARVEKLRELLRHCLSLLSDFGIGQERLDVIGEIQDELAKA
jgi:hypothetical protein